MVVVVCDVVVVIVCNVVHHLRPGRGPRAGSSLRFILFLKLIRGCERDSGGLVNFGPAVLRKRDAEQLRAVRGGAGEDGLLHFARAPLEEL